VLDFHARSEKERVQKALRRLFMGFNIGIIVDRIGRFSEG
jgi:hypothetical protein